MNQGRREALGRRAVGAPLSARVLLLVLLPAVPAAADPADPEGVATAWSSALSPSRLATLALQIALEARGYSPGLLDGVSGPRTAMALAALQSGCGLPPTGERDARTLAVLAPSPGDALAWVRVRAEDLSQVDPPPRDWIERSRRTRLLYPSLASLIAERVHTSERFLAALNPGLDLSLLRPGDLVLAPSAPEGRRPAVAIERLEIDLERKIVLIFSPGNRAPAALLFCSIAADPARAPLGDAHVAVVAHEPTYTFDPAKWPEIRGVDRKLLIPPGPRSPVGLRWIGLDRDGIGIHGAPEPEMIGKTGSHGCFRLTNWDAIWLADLVYSGLPVKIVRNAGASSWSWTGPGHVEG